MKLLPSWCVLCTPYNHAPCHFMQLDSHEEASPEEFKSREVVLCYRERVGLLLLQLFPNSGATDSVFVTLFCTAVGTAIAWCCGGCAMPDGHCLNILLFWRQSTAASVFQVGACFEVSLFCPPFPLVPVPNRPCLLYTSPSPRDISGSRMPSSA